MTMDASSVGKSLLLSRWMLAGLLLIFTLIWFSNIEERKLFRPDEGRYAEIAREMALSGDWITPRLNGLKYFEKPPLQYWATAAAFKLFGEHHWTARWWPVTTTFASVLLMFWVGRRLYGEAAGLAAAAALGGCTWFILNGHFNALDAGLSAFFSVALLSFLMAQRADATVLENRNWMLAVWAALALAVLSKGLIGVVLPGAVLALYLLVERDWRMLTRLHLGKGLAVLLLMTAPWFIAVSWSNEEFARFFFIHEHAERFLTPVHRREGVWWYFVPLLLLGAMPWTPFIALRLRAGWLREGGRGSLQPLRLALIWTGFTVVFFSLSHSKLPSYILPVFPALALFIGVQMLRMEEAVLSRVAWGLAIIGGALLFVVLLGNHYLVRLFSSQASPTEVVRNVAPWLLASIAVFTAGACAAAGLFQRQQVLAAILLLAFGSLGAGMLGMSGHDQLSRLYSAWHIVREIEATHGPLNQDIPFYSIQMHDQTLPFYLRRPVILVQYIDEFALGLQAEPDKGIARVESWMIRWRDQTVGYAIMAPDNYQRLVAQDLPMRVLARDPRRVIVSRQ